LVELFTAPVPRLGKTDCYPARSTTNVTREGERFFEHCNQDVTHIV
jgi:hypothetical protein